MKITTYPNAESFLVRAQAALESSEVANCLMLGVCLRLDQFRKRLTTPPYLTTVGDDRGLVLAAMITPPHNLVVNGFRDDLAGGARLLVADLLSGGWKVPGALGPKEVVGTVAGRWAQATGQELQVLQHQRLYALVKVETPVPERGQLRLATAGDTELVAEWRYGFHRDIQGHADREESRRAADHRVEDGTIYLWEDGQPVCMAGKTRPTRNGSSIGPVYTPPELCNRGYATACVGELGRLLLASGWAYCALFTDLANPASNRIYQRIGYRPVCDYDQCEFADEG